MSNEPSRIETADESPEIIAFENGAKDNPYNWSKAKKIYIIAIGSLIGLNSTVASSLPSLASPQLQRHFNVTVQQQLVLPNSVYLISRSTFGVVLPFAARPMYEKLGVAWACSLLGFLSLPMCLIPFAFIHYGPQLRENSPVCKELAKEQEDKARQI